MKTAEWFFLVFSWAAMLGLTVFCFCRIFTKKKI